MLPYLILFTRQANFLAKAEGRARQKSKAEREAEAEAAREASLATPLPETNKGFKMMAKFGFKLGDTLGKSKDARKEPIQVKVKGDKSGIGHESEKKRKFREIQEKAEQATKRAKEEEIDYLEDLRKQRKDRKAEKDLDDAQRTAERLFEKEAEETKTTANEEKPLKEVNVLWRGRARRQAEHQRERRQQRELDDSLTYRRLISSNGDDELDMDSKIALGHDIAPFYTSPGPDSEEDDPELAEFEALPITERLKKVLNFLRETYHYCLYCGYQYPDPAMEGCPGVTEDDHD